MVQGSTRVTQTGQGVTRVVQNGTKRYKGGARWYKVGTRARRAAIVNTSAPPAHSLCTTRHSDPAERYLGVAVVGAAVGAFVGGAVVGDAVGAFVGAAVVGDAVGALGARVGAEVVLQPQLLNFSMFTLLL